MKYLIILIFFVNSVKAQNLTTSEILSNTAKTILLSQSIEFKCKYLFKGFNFDMERDTYRLNTDIFLRRECNDELFGGSIIYSDNRNRTIIYNNEKTYAIDQESGLVQFQENHSKNNNIILSTNAYGALFFYYLHPNSLNINRQTIQDSDTVLNGIPCYQIKIYQQVFKGKNAKQDHLKICINKSNYFPISFANYYYMGDHNQYNYLEINDVKININYDSILKTRLDFQDFKVLNYDYLLDSVVNFTLVGKSYNKIQGLNSSNGKTEIIKFKNKLTLLDFWYIGCGACKIVSTKLDSIIELTNNNDLKVYGMNSVDNSPTGIEKLSNYFKKYPNNYPTLLIDPSVDKSFNIAFAPTLILLDSKGKVIWTSIGLTEEKKAELKKIIKETLK